MAGKQSYFDTTAYYARGNILTLEPRLGYEPMQEKIRKLAPKFWGIPSSNTVTPPVPDVDNRLIQLKNILKDAPKTDQFGDTASWAYETSVSEIKHAADQASQRVFKHHKTVRRSGPQQKRTSHLTRLEVFRTGDVAAQVLKHLQAEGDPVAEAIISLTQWRLDRVNPEPLPLYVSLGHAAFEYTLFATRSEEIGKQMSAIILSDEIVSTEKAPTF
jgi:hypothetical protein